MGLATSGREEASYLMVFFGERYWYGVSTITLERCAEKEREKENEKHDCILKEFPGIFLLSTA